VGMNVFVAMTPVPKGRPRITRRGIAYTPKRTVDAEKRIAWAVSKAWKEKPDEVSRFSLKIEVHFRLKGRGDWDNYGKIVSDTLNGLVWGDDAQVDYGSVVMVRHSKCVEGLRIEVNRL